MKTMKLRTASRTFIVQVVGLVLLWCLAIFTLYQIRTFSFQTLKIPASNYQFIFYNTDNEPAVDYTNAYKKVINLPIDYWNKNRDKLNNRESCASFPNPLTIQFHQTYWQSFTTSKNTGRMFNAYFDNREENEDIATVRILAMIENDNVLPSVYCQLWFEEQLEPVIVKADKSINIWHNQQNEVFPTLINCILPIDYKKYVPVAVSLVENPCDAAKNILKVNYNKHEKKKDFAVCVKGLDMPNKNLSIRIIEWIELLNILGADKLFFYDINLHPNVTKVLSHYENEGKAIVTELKLAESSYELTKMQREVIPYTDCFYKHMYEFKYIVILDIDEILLPTKSNTWRDLVVSNSIKNENALYNVKSMYFLDEPPDVSHSFDGLPPYMNILQNIYRKNDTTELTTVQTFFNTEKVVTLHNDLPIKCLGNCLSYPIELDNAQLQHYREACTYVLYLAVNKNCLEFSNGTVIDKHIWNFREALVERVTSTINYLGIPAK